MNRAFRSNMGLSGRCLANPMLDLLTHMPSHESGCILFILYQDKGLFNNIIFLWVIA